MPIKKTKLVKLVKCSAKREFGWLDRDEVAMYKRLVGTLVEVEALDDNRRAPVSGKLQYRLAGDGERELDGLFFIYVDDCEDCAPPPRLKVRTIRCL